MAERDILVLGTSAGGVEALARLVRLLPPGFPAALFVVCHVPASARSNLPEILSRNGPLLAHHAQDGEPIRHGQIYVAPPDFHLMLRPGTVQLAHGARENHHRPAIDPLFRTAARAYGQRVIGVVLTGTQSDGSAGLLAIRGGGGVAIVQDPAEAFAPMMPQRAQAIAGADYVLPVAEMAPLLVSLVQHPSPQEGVSNVTDPLENMLQRVRTDMISQRDGGHRGQLTVYTCPECGGVLWQVDDAGLIRFRCHTGHVFYADSLLGEQSEALEAALFTAVRIFKEKMILTRQLAAVEGERGNRDAARRFDEEAHLAESYADLILRHVLHVTVGPAAAPEETGAGASAAQPAPS